MPLVPAGVVAVGSAAYALAEATVRGLRAGATLRAAAGRAVLTVLGPAETLPWADGAAYVGWEDGMLVSTTHRPEPTAAFLVTTVAGAALAVVTPDHLVLSDAMPHRAADPSTLFRHLGDRDG